MKRIGKIQTTSEYNKLIGLEILHPLVSVVDFSKAKAGENNQRVVDALSFGFYSIFFKNDKNCTIKYGRSNYDYQEGSLIFIAPEQVVSIEEDGEDYIPNGFALSFHPDLLLRTSLISKMKNYTFFSYNIREALHLSESEKSIVLDIFNKINDEISRPIDKHSKDVIVSNIELLLNYCMRFYDRQFITRDNINNTTVEKIKAIILNYFQSDKPQLIGTPTVSYIAKEVHLSANYLGDLIKKEIGKSAQEYIHSLILEIAKEKMFESDKSISQISNELGFKYPHHFTQIFQTKRGIDP
jgi:AraC-like DNA-binding protein